MRIQDTHYFTTNTLTNGTQVSDRLSSGLYTDTCFYLQFFNQAAVDNRIPTGATVVANSNGTGTALVEVSEDGVNWGLVTNGTITLGGGYDRPVVIGCAFKFVRLTLTGVTVSGAASLRLVMNKG